MKTCSVCLFYPVTASEGDSNRQSFCETQRDKMAEKVSKKRTLKVDTCDPKPGPSPKRANWNKKEEEGPAGQSRDCAQIPAAANCWIVPSLTDMATRAAGKAMSASPDGHIKAWMAACSNLLCGEDIFLSAALMNEGSKPLFWWFDKDRDRTNRLVGLGLESSRMAFGLQWLSNEEHPTHKSKAHTSVKKKQRELCTYTNLLLERAPSYSFEDVEKLGWSYFQARMYPQLESLAGYLANRWAKEAGIRYWGSSEESPNGRPCQEVEQAEAKIVEANTLKALAMLNCTDVVNARCLFPDSKNSLSLSGGFCAFRTALSAKTVAPLIDLLDANVNDAPDNNDLNEKVMQKVQGLAESKVFHPYHETPGQLFRAICSGSVRERSTSANWEFYNDMEMLIDHTASLRYEDNVNFHKACNNCENRPFFMKLVPTFVTKILCHVGKMEAALQLKRTAEAVYIGVMAIEDMEDEVQARKNKTHGVPQKKGTFLEAEEELSNFSWEESWAMVRALCLLAEALSMISSPPSVPLACIAKARLLAQAATKSHSRHTSVFFECEIVLSAAIVQSNFHMFCTAFSLFRNLAKNASSLPAKSCFYWEYLLAYSESLLMFSRVSLSQYELSSHCPVDEMLDAPWSEEGLGKDDKKTQERRSALLLSKVKLSLSEAYQLLQELDDATALMNDISTCVKCRTYVLRMEHNLYNHELTTQITVAPKHASERAALRWEIKKSNYVLASSSAHRLGGYAPYGCGPETYWGARLDITNVSYDAYKDYSISPTECRRLCSHATLRTWSNESINFIVSAAQAFSSQGYIDREYMLWLSAAEKIMMYTNERHPLTCLVYRRVLRSVNLHVGTTSAARNTMFNWRLEIAKEIKKEAIRQATSNEIVTQTFAELKNYICGDPHSSGFILYAHNHADKLLWVKEMKLFNEEENDNDDTRDSDSDEGNSESE